MDGRGSLTGSHQLAEALNNDGCRAHVADAGSSWRREEFNAGPMCILKYLLRLFYDLCFVELDFLPEYACSSAYFDGKYVSLDYG